MVTHWKKDSDEVLFAGRETLMSVCLNNYDYDAVAMMTNNCAIVAYGKTCPIVSSAMPRLMNFSENFGCLMLGASTDISLIIEKFKRQEDLSPPGKLGSIFKLRLLQLTEKVRVLEYRHCAAAFVCVSPSLSGGVDMCLIGPMGGCQPINVKAFGPNRKKIEKYLRRKYSPDLNCNQLFCLGTKCFMEGIGRIYPGEFHIASWIGNKFHIIPDSHIMNYLGVSNGI